VNTTALNAIPTLGLGLQRKTSVISHKHNGLRQQSQQLNFKPGEIYLMAGSPIRRLRERLGESRPEFAKRIGRGEAALERYEADIPLEWLQQLKALAEEHSFSDLAEEFAELAGAEAPELTFSESSSVDLGKIPRGPLRTLLQHLAVIYTHPITPLDENIPGLIKSAIQLRARHQNDK
jgi:transcriptional regulator with XRE-family HTH domain